MAGESPTKPVFTEKEDRVLKLAWCCLKSVPEIDLEKLTKLGGFNTQKTASNTWGVIKKKLAAMYQDANDGNEDPNSLTPTPKGRPGKGNVTPAKRKKAAAKFDDGEDEGDDDMGDEGEIKRQRQDSLEDGLEQGGL